MRKSQSTAQQLRSFFSSPKPVVSSLKPSSCNGGRKKREVGLLFLSACAGSRLVREGGVMTPRHSFEQHSIFSAFCEVPPFSIGVTTSRRLFKCLSAASVYRRLAVRTGRELLKFTRCCCIPTRGLAIYCSSAPKVLSPAYVIYKNPSLSLCSSYKADRSCAVAGITVLFTNK